MTAPTALDSSTLTDLATTLRGPLVLPGDERYDEARSVYNAMIDRKPTAIAYCTDVADVMAGVKAAREHGALLAIRSGGHSGPGLGVADDALVLDLSRMRGIHVDPAKRTARVGPGCTWGDVDHATHGFGLAVPSGIVSTTGVGGLTLGGGHGVLTRKFGLTIDNLLSADVVLADGSVVTTSRRQHPDLFWAIRGGGGNFGVVTSFEFRLHPVSTVYAGPMLWPIERTAELLHWYDGFLKAARNDLTGYFVLMTVPPAPMFPEALHGRKMCGVLWTYLGPDDKAERALKRARKFAKPVWEHVGRMPYPALQSLFDGLYPPGLQWYWKGHFVRELPPAALALHQEYGEKLPSMHSTMHLYPIDGAVHKVDADDTAFRYRDARWSQVIVGVDPDPANAGAITEWTRSYWEALRQYSASGGYLNFAMDEGTDRTRASYGENYDQLASVKATYDPHNLFRVNHNVPPGP